MDYQDGVSTIDQEKTKENAGGSEGEGPSSMPAARVINVNHGIIDAEAEARLKAELRNATDALDVMSISPALKKFGLSPA